MVFKPTVAPTVPVTMIAGTTPGGGFAEALRDHQPSGQLVQTRPGAKAKIATSPRPAARPEPGMSLP